MLRQPEATPTHSGAPNSRIITTASMYAFFGGVRVAAYMVSKWGTAKRTKALANERASSGIKVNCIALGSVWADPIRSGMCGRIICASGRYLLAFPVGRWGEPEDVAGVAVFLASKDSDLLHAGVLPVDGGFLVR